MQKQSERMSAVDAAWLRMDRPTNLMMIVGVVVFDEQLDFARFRATIGDRFLEFPRFRCRAVQDTVSASWEPDPAFDLDQHVTRIALPAPAGQAELEELVSELAGTDLDRRRPMWQFHFVENFGRGTAVILRIHHCYADGIAMVRVFLTLTDLQPQPAAAEPAAPQGPAKKKRRGGDGDGTPWLGRLGVPGLGLVQKAYAEGAEWFGKALDLTRHPEQANELAKHALGIAAELARVATLPDDPPTRFKGALGTRKIAAWTDPLPLAEVKTVARALGCTINDLLMSTAAGALGSYLRAHGEDTDGMTIRATVPVNLRDPAAAAELGNHFGLVFLELPVGIRNPLERVFAVHAAMSALKSSYQPVLTLGLMAALGMMPGQVETAAIDLLSTKASAVATNVPGPSQRLYLAGSPIARLIFWVPQSGDIGLGISILSYAGQVQFGLIADYKRVPDPGAVTARFHQEFEKVVCSLLMGPYLKTGR
ncbi:MAG: wax ester/triacylglycerol synthase family O-acyltransferase [Steroidobacteraceae bacterium]|nr:wax ester/triacylglycerol synthase family O-acyltransferase [Steroidobacteraceae bacterium]